MVFEELSKCPICGSELNLKKEYILVPHMIANERDDLYVFSDSGIHLSCIEQDPIKDKLFKHISLYQKFLPPSKLICIVDGKSIENPRDALFTGLLTSDEKEKLFDFNYISLNLKNISRWKQYENFIEISNVFLSENKWLATQGFNKLTYLMEKMREAKTTPIN
jgi:hypothetical protein